MGTPADGGRADTLVDGGQADTPAGATHATAATCVLQVDIAVSPAANRCTVCETKGVVLRIVEREIPDA